MLVAVALAPASHGRFSAANVTTISSVAIATIEPRAGAPGYSWLRVYFYSAALTAEDRAATAQGRERSIKARWSAVLQLTVDKGSKLTQLDLSVPGHQCTVGDSQRELDAAFQTFQFDGTHLRLLGKGAHVCDMRSMGIPNQTFTWDVDVDIPVASVPR
jgi:hypothetical protein